MQEKEYKKFCPLLSIGNDGPYLVPCQENECAWYNGGQCALCSIADNLGEIAVSSDDLKNLAELPVRLKN